LSGNWIPDQYRDGMRVQRFVARSTGRCPHPPILAGGLDGSPRPAVSFVGQVEAHAFEQILVVVDCVGQAGDASGGLSKSIAGNPVRECRVGGKPDQDRRHFAIRIGGNKKAGSSFGYVCRDVTGARGFLRLQRIRKLHPYVMRRQDCVKFAGIDIGRAPNQDLRLARIAGPLGIEVGQVHPPGNGDEARG